MEALAEREAVGVEARRGVGRHGGVVPPPFCAAAKGAMAERETTATATARARRSCSPRGRREELILIQERGFTLA